MNDKDDDEEVRVVAEHQRDLQTKLFDIESRFDGATLLVAGGAFTVSATLVPRLAQGGVLAWALLAAWGAWAACLCTCVGGQQLSAHCYRRRIEHVDGKRYNELWRKNFWENCLPRVNVAAFVLLLLGFVFFGVYTFANLNSGAQDGQSQKEGEEKSIIAVAPTQGVQRAESAVGVSQAAGHTRAEVVSDGRETKAAAGTPPLRAQGQAGTVGPSGPRQSDQRAAPAAGVPQAPAEKVAP